MPASQAERRVSIAVAVLISGLAHATVALTLMSTSPVTTPPEPPSTFMITFMSENAAATEPTTTESQTGRELPAAPDSSPSTISTFSSTAETAAVPALHQAPPPLEGKVAEEKPTKSRPPRSIARSSNSTTAATKTESGSEPGILTPTAAFESVTAALAVHPTAAPGPTASQDSLAEPESRRNSFDTELRIVHAPPPPYPPAARRSNRHGSASAEGRRTTATTLAPARCITSTARLPMNPPAPSTAMRPLTPTPLRQAGATASTSCGVARGTHPGSASSGAPPPRRPSDARAGPR